MDCDQTPSAPSVHTLLTLVQKTELAEWNSDDEEEPTVHHGPFHDVVRALAYGEVSDVSGDEVSNLDDDDASSIRCSCNTRVCECTCSECAIAPED